MPGSLFPADSREIAWDLKVFQMFTNRVTDPPRFRARFLIARETKIYLLEGTEKLRSPKKPDNRPPKSTQVELDLSSWIWRPMFSNIFLVSKNLKTGATKESVHHLEILQDGLRVRT